MEGMKKRRINNTLDLPHLSPEELLDPLPLFPLLPEPDPLPDFPDLPDEEPEDPQPSSPQSY